MEQEIITGIEEKSTYLQDLTENEEKFNIKQV